MNPHKIIALFFNLVLAFGIATAALPARAAVSATLNYQGQLTNAAGVPVNSGPAGIGMTFKLYDAATAGNLLWAEPQTVVVSNGLYSVTLGKTTPLTPALFGVPLYLGIAVGADAEMAPRIALSSSATALRAALADTAATADALAPAATVAGSQVSGTLSGATLGNTALGQLDTRYLPLTGTALATADGSGQMGWSSAKLGADGLPVIAYIDVTHSSLKVVKCGNGPCSAGNTTATVDAADPTSTVSLALGADGLPVISYMGGTFGGLRTAKCGNAACASGNTLSTLEAGETGQYSAVAVAASGIPVISYYNIVGGDLKVALCANAVCSAAKVIQTVDSAGNVGQFTSIAIGADGFPVISYYDATSFRPKVAKCGNANCSTRTISMVGAAGTTKVGQYTSIAVPAGGLPVISFYDMENFDLRVAKCGDAACAGATESPVDTAGNVGLNTSLTLGADGLPVISYYDATNAHLKTAKCGNANCSAGNLYSVVDTAPSTVPYGSVAIGQNGNPVIAYSTSTGLNLAACQTAACGTVANATPFAASQVTGPLTAATIDASRITGTIVGLQGPQGIQGPAGATGSQGPQGIQGVAGPIAGLEFVSYQPTQIGTNVFGDPKYSPTIMLDCPPPKIAIAGGCGVVADNVSLVSSRPINSSTWYCRWNGNDDLGGTIVTVYGAPTAYATCVNP